MKIGKTVCAWHFIAEKQHIASNCFELLGELP